MKYTGIDPPRSAEVQQLRALAGYKTHGGYAWAAVTKEGETLCVKCIRKNYRMHLRATKYPGKGWGNMDAIAGLINSGEFDGDEGPEYCADCNELLWGEM